jgi:hypothetical protein
MKTRGVLPSRGLFACLCVVAATACASSHIASVNAASPERSAIVMRADDREHFLEGMRGYLDAMQGLIEGLAANDRAAMAQSARKAGVGALMGASPAVAFKLPGEFVLLALDTHQKFDLIAQAAEGQASKKEILDQMGAVLANCSACHAMYRISP